MAHDRRHVILACLLNSASGLQPVKCSVDAGLGCVDADLLLRAVVGERQAGIGGWYEVIDAGEGSKVEGGVSGRVLEGGVGGDAGAAEDRDVPGSGLEGGEDAALVGVEVPAGEVVGDLREGGDDLLGGDDLRALWGIEKDEVWQGGKAEDSLDGGGQADGVAEEAAGGFEEQRGVLRRGCEEGVKEDAVDEVRVEVNQLK